MNISLEDLEIAYARICGCPPLEKVIKRFDAEIEEILRAHGVPDAAEKLEKLRFTEAELQFLRDRKGRVGAIYGRRRRRSRAHL